MLQCVVIAVVVATATETSIYYVDTDVSAIEHRDFYKEVAKLAYRDRNDVQDILKLEGLPPRARTNRCGFEYLYASLTGDDT